MPTALLLISFQSKYFRKKGNQNVKDAKKSAKSAAKLLGYFRENNLPIVHILQTGKLEDLTAEMLQPLDLLEPKHEESTLVTNEENAFADPKLVQILESLETDHLLVAGLTAENQILFTVKGARERGYSCTVAQDACAATTLKYDGEKIKAEQVHQLIMALMESMEVEITTSKEYIKAEQKKLKKQAKANAEKAAMEEAARLALQEANEAKPISATSKNGRKKTSKTVNTTEPTGNTETRKKKSARAIESFS